MVRQLSNVKRRIVWYDNLTKTVYLYHVPCVTRHRKLREILNIRLDEPMAREIARIAADQGRSESEAARTLLGFGIEVVRRLEVRERAEPFGWDRKEEDPLNRWPTTIEIEARERPMTDEEVDRAGLRAFVGGYPDERPWEE